ncbi:hypothetical protein GCM10009678_09950 [Actinomadura kijaniata]|uniref:Uncharacterized protein n=1 Tax=Actinomadura namibiensis TaxID=182080 RepID=A0A7W3LJJ3_ACTNM|nr:MULTISPECIES: hypothetical protein [Actinomadura]MBA8949265.1 hypothetical protein [Actinomadura namibiensis]
MHNGIHIDRATGRLCAAAFLPGLTVSAFDGLRLAQRLLTLVQSLL